MNRIWVISMKKDNQNQAVVWERNRRMVKNRSIIFMGFLLLVEFLLILCFHHSLPVSAESTPSVAYSAHVENIGWMQEQTNGAEAGTTGRSLRVEALKIHISGDSNLGISYQTHVQDIGWQKWVENGAVAGTTGRALRLEAIRIRLTGQDASAYDVYYCVHIQDYGWLNWAKNGQTAGSSGYGLRMEALKILILPKGSQAPANLGNCTSAVISSSGEAPRQETPSLTYRGHFSNIGWTTETADGQADGNENTYLEAFSVRLENAGASGIRYKAHVQKIGWQDWTYNDQAAGTVGQSLRIEALSMELYGGAASEYDLYYCVYVKGVGWLNWAKNGETAGSTGESLPISAYRVMLVTKGAGQPANCGSLPSAVLGAGPSIHYEVHEGNVGWKAAVSDGAGAGDAGSGNALEALKIYGDDDQVSLSYSTYVEGSGWQNASVGGAVSGTTGQSKALDAVKISLAGSSANLYDVYYRTYLRNYGWLNWAKNGELSGSDSLGYPIEGLQVVLKIKGTPLKASDGLSIASISGNLAGISCACHVQDVGWQNPVTDGETAGTTGRGLRVEAFKVSKVSTNLTGSVQYRAHVENIGWQGWQSDGAIAGTTGRSLRIEAVSIRLTGQMNEVYDVYYRCHIQNKGWTGWAKNGANCGSQGLNLRMEAIQIVLHYKGQDAPGDLINTFYLPLKGGQGIDVSSYQGDIDWAAASKSVNFAIIRANSHKNGIQAEDTKFKINMYGAKLNNVQVGAYCYSLAKTKEEAVEEAKETIARVKASGGTDYPIFIDQEDSSLTELTNSQRTEIIQSFVDTVNNAGYLAGVYSYYYWLKDKVYLSSIHNAFIWVAHTSAVDLPIPGAVIWQYSHTGSIPGINGRVDLDRSYF
jgi:uncharacterized protein YjdB